MTTIDDVLASDDAHSETVEVPEWGGTIRVQSITVVERARVERLWSGNGKSDPVALRAELLLAALKREDGLPFASREQIDEMLKTKNASIVERLVDAALRVSGLAEIAERELEKN